MANRARPIPDSVWPTVKRRVSPYEHFQWVILDPTAAIGRLYANVPVHRHVVRVDVPIQAADAGPIFWDRDTVRRHTELPIDHLVRFELDLRRSVGRWGLRIASPGSARRTRDLGSGRFRYERKDRQP